MEKVYKDDETKLRTYRRRMNMADKQFKQLKPQAEKRIQKYHNDPNEEEGRSPKGHRVSTPLGTAIIDSMFSSLTAVEVDFSLTNLGHGTRDQARMAQAALRQEWREAEGDEKVEDATKDALVVGIGWVKVGYDYAEEERPLNEDEKSERIKQLYAQTRELSQVPEDIPPPEAALQALEGETVAEVLRDRIVVDYVPWDELRWDPTAKRARDIRWIAQVTKVPLHEVVDNPVFEEYARKRKNGLQELRELKADSEVGEEVRGESPPDEDDDRLTITEMWDLETGTVCTFGRSSGDFILNEQPNPFAINPELKDRSPFVPLILRTRMDSVVGLSDMEVVHPTVQELNEYRSNIVTYLARFVPKMYGPKDAFTETGKTALESKDYGAYAELEDGVDVSQIDTLDPPALPQEVFRMEERVEQSALDATGSNELLRGLFADRRTTATEVATVDRQSNVRHSEKRNRMARFYQDIARRILFLMQTFYDAPRITRMTGEQADEIWTWTSEDIVLETQLEVHLSPKETKTQQSRFDFAIAVMNVLLPVAEQLGMDAQAIIRWSAEEMGIAPDALREFFKTPEEVAQGNAEALQLQAEQQAVAEGLPPDMSQVPGMADAPA